jgi:hypothetical protein
MLKIENPSQYVGRIPPDVAKELGVDIDDFLDEIHDQGYYYCPKCGKIVSSEELEDDYENPCNACK